MIDLKILKQLVRMMSENDLTELDLEDGGEKVKLRRRSDTPEVQYVASAPAAPVVTAAPAPAPAAASANPAPAGGANDGSPSLGKTIDSPMVGTFYSSPTPDAKPFVAVGDSVDSDAVVCIVEAMKVFNEIKAETSGKIKRVLVENGQSVEFGQPLFEIE